MNLTPQAAARLRRELAAIDLDLELALAEIRLNGIASRLDRLEAVQRQRQRFDHATAHAATAEHARQVRQQRMAAGLATAFALGAGAIASSASMRHPMGLPEL